MEAIRGRWTAEGLPVATGGGTEGPWCKGAAVAECLEQLDTEWVAISDADVWCHQWQEALDLAIRRKRDWAIPHGTVYRLDERSTVEWIERGTVRSPLFVRWPYEGRPGGGLTLIKRSVYDEVPIDRRFVGWGQEDDAWGLALHTLIGRPHRGRHPLWHLWHPPQDRISEVAGSQESLALYAQYRRMRRNPAELAEWVALGH